MLHKPICGLCDSPTESISVPCSSCGAKYHPVMQCTGLSVTAIKCVLEEAESGIQYVCTRCRCAGPRSPTSGGQGDQGGMGQLYNLVKSISLSVNKLSNEVASLCKNKAPARATP